MNDNNEVSLRDVWIKERKEVTSEYQGEKPKIKSNKIQEW